MPISPYDGYTAGSNWIRANQPVVVDNITALRALDKTKIKYAITKGYYTPGDGGAGEYWYDSSDTTSTDNGGAIITASDGGRWKLNACGVVKVKQFGAKGDASTDDTSALQNFFTYLSKDAFSRGTSLSGYFQRGIYVVSSTINIVNGFFLGNLFTDGPDACLVKSTANVTFLLKGGSGNLSGAEWQGISIDGGTNSGANEAVRVDGLGFFQWKNLKLYNVFTGVRLYNLSGGNFTEGALFPYLFTESSVTYSMRLSVGAGTNSFRTSGLPYARAQIPQGGALLLVDSGCLPYMFNISGVTCWMTGSSGTQQLFKINSSENGMSFIGDISVEMGSSQTVQLFTTGKSLSWSGGIVSQGASTMNNIQCGMNVMRGQDSYTLSDGALSSLGPLSFFHTTSVLGESVSLVGSTLCTNGYLLSIRVDGPGYYYQSNYIVVHQGYGGNQAFSLLSTLLFNDGAGWGAPTITAGANNLTISNTKWTVGTTIRWTTVPIESLSGTAI